MKHGALEEVECNHEDIFRVASLRRAGICGVFPDHENAQAFIEKLRKEQQRINQTIAALHGEAMYEV